MMPKAMFRAIATINNIKGLRARGGFEVDMQWKDGKLLYDSTKLRFTNSEQANKLLTRRPRDGWYL